MVRFSDIARSFPYPVLEEGNLSYPEGEYAADVERKSDTSVSVNHKISNAALLENLIDEKIAKYACLVSIPLTNYRKIHISDSRKQEVEWDIGVVGQSPMIRPIIVSVEETELTLKKEDNVAEMWQGEKILIPKGARLALENYMRSFSSLQSLIELVKGESFLSGTFQVDPVQEQGFYFKVQIAEDLFNFIHAPRGDEINRKNIITHIVNRCLEILARDYAEYGNDGGDYPNLDSLEKYLKDEKQPSWTDEGFASDKVATNLYPIKIPAIDTGEEQ